MAAASAPFTDVCLLILKGDHCFLHETDPMTGQTVYEPTYFWTGDAGPAHGRLRIGSVPGIWPACGEGSTITTLPVQSLPKGTGVGAALPSVPGTVKSVIWEDADSSGKIIGIRSMRCNLECGPMGE
ncbi:hypothetical protein [Agromyces aerolatus]|uniref:hypothetical protein n=1 Tax=Agromyces sp. LY-1074 TaxID=3074080 RepID=UPI00285AAACD|nr:MULTISPECIES: hypothetical protein [unclassified Agromyces]MDR5701238.1 hypothetical protein [Agromyces sp. LY-1074]MDR5706886.1 hypothetical protein [Agromyces sp. LY-1358]